jgi:hypothetical protein
MKCTALICSERIIIDAFTTKPSFINYIDGEILSQTFPFGLPFMVYSKFEKGKEEGIEDIYLEIRLNNKSLNKFKVGLNFTQENKPSVSILNAGIIQIAEPGILSIVILNQTDNNVELYNNSIKFSKLTEPVIPFFNQKR